MSGDSERYLRAADGIPQGGLSAIAGEVISDADVARLFHKHVAFRENERFLGMQGGAVDGYQLRGAAAFEKFNNDLARRNGEGRTSQTYDTVLHLALLDSLNRQIDFLSDRIAQSESGFEARYGEDWREQFAERILDPDDIPQRRDGESMAEYRERLENALVAEMLDENGNIKPEYANDPEMSAWARWAKDEYEKQQAERDRDYIDDPSIDAAERARRREEVVNSASFEARDELWQQSNDAEMRSALERAEDNSFDAATVASSDVALDNAGF